MSFRSPASTALAVVLGLALASPGAPATAAGGARSNGSSPSGATSNTSTLRLVIPRIGLNTRTASSLDAGPWMYYRDRDTVAIAGHRTTHSRPFYSLPSLRRGDRIWLGGYRFVVRRTAIVRPWDTWVLNYPGLVLSACTPAGSASYRVVVFAAYLPR